MALGWLSDVKKPNTQNLVPAGNIDLCVDLELCCRNDLMEQI